MYCLKVFKVQFIVTAESVVMRIIVVIRTNRMHTFYIKVLITYIVFDMFRTSNCSSSG